MKILFLSSDFNIVDEWRDKIFHTNTSSCYDISSLSNELKKSPEAIVIADYDSLAHDINNMIATASAPLNLIVLERAPSVVTGKMLILRGIKAYGNSRMHKIHFTQMVETLKDKNIWTYPELTASLASTNSKTGLSKESSELIEERLTQKEKDVLMLILNGLTNDAIASSLGITTRTVKAHVSSIFSKLHVNDRVSLILLLK